MMYQEKDYLENRAQLRVRLTAVLVPVICLFVLMLVSFFLRWPQAITMARCSVTVGGFICAYCLFIAPVIAYGRHIDHALHGRTRQTEGVFLSMEEESVARDGVDFFAMTANVGQVGNAEDDRLFYFDANLPRPDFREGERLRLTSYDNRVTNWEKI